MTRPSAVPPPVTAVLDASSTWLPVKLGEVEDLLREQTSGNGEALDENAGSTLAAGGKRLRPLLVLLCAGPAADGAAVRAAAAVELVHMATLVHDDVLDAAPLRRGRPTVVATAGRELAVATGDLLLSRSFAVLAAADDAGAVERLATASVALARGELAQRQDAFDAAIPERRYLERCRLKTAALFECAVLLGWESTRAAGAPGAEEMAAFGSGIGLAFQLLDDVLDVSGPAERTGKAPGTDLLDGTVTLPLILAAEANPGLRELDLHGLDELGVAGVCDRITATGALDAVRARALDLVAGAKRKLGRAGLDAEQQRLLGLVADGVVQRYS